MDMGKTDKCNLREDETLAEVVKNTNVCMINIFPDKLVICIFLFPHFKYSANPLLSRFSFKPSFPNSL